MKIYTKVVIDIETGKVLEAESFDYDGELALCCMGGDTPKPSHEERALQQQQLDILEQQQEETALMRPFVLSGMGLIADAQTGELRYMTEEEKLAGMSDVDREQYEITQLGQERQRKAYAGELPISPALEQSLKDEEAKLVEALSRQLGPDFMSTTSGQQAMMRFTQKANLVREEARRGEISGGGANVFQGLSYMGGTAATRTATAAGFPGRTGGISSQYGGILDRMANERMMQYQAQTQRQAGFMGGMGQLIGSGIQAYGTYAGLKALAPAAAVSSIVLKENVETIKSPVEAVTAIRGVVFNWKEDGKQDIGVIAEEVGKIVPEAVTVIDGVNHVFYHKLIPYLIEAVKEQQLQIDALKGVSHA